MKAIRDDSASGRFYVIGTQRYPSVTHILQAIGKPALVNWAASTERTLVSETAADLYHDVAQILPPLPRAMFLTTLLTRLGKVRAHQRELEQAATIGSQAHALVEWNLRKMIGPQLAPEPRVSVDAARAFGHFQAWADSVHLRPVRIEETVWSDTYQYAGTMDLLANVDHRLMLIDFKTSKAVYQEALLQNVAYQVALAEMGHGTPDGGLIVRLPKLASDPTFEVVTVPPVDELLPVFLAARQIWQWWHAAEEAYRAKQAAG